MLISPTDSSALPSTNPAALVCPGAPARRRRQPPRNAIQNNARDLARALASEVQEPLTTKKVKELAIQVSAKNQDPAVLTQVHFINALGLGDPLLKQDIALDTRKSTVNQDSVVLVFKTDKKKPVYFSNNHEGRYSGILLKLDTIAVACFSQFRASDSPENLLCSEDARLEIQAAPITESDHTILCGYRKTLFPATALSAFDKYNQTHSSQIVRITKLTLTLPIERSPIDQSN